MLHPRECGAASNSEGNAAQQAITQRHKGATRSCATRSSAEAGEEAAGTAEAREGHVFEITKGRTCRIDIAAHYIQAKAACVYAFLHGNIQGLLQGPGPRHRALGVLLTEVDAHEHEAPEPRAGLLKIICLPPTTRSSLWTYGRCVQPRAASYCPRQPWSLAVTVWHPTRGRSMRSKSCSP